MNRLALGLLAVCGALALAVAGLVAYDRQSAGAGASCARGHFHIALWGDCGGPMVGGVAVLSFILFVLLWPTITVLAIALVRWSGLLWRRLRPTARRAGDGARDRRRR